VLLALGATAFWALRCRRSGSYTVNPHDRQQETSPRLITFNRRAEEGGNHGTEQLVIQIDRCSVVLSACSK
jgi:hypothetical protein